jgi:hypothetical protein
VLKANVARPLIWKRRRLFVELQAMATLGAADPMPNTFPALEVFAVVAIRIDGLALQSFSLSPRFGAKLVRLEGESLPIGAHRHGLIQNWLITVTTIVHGFWVSSLSAPT